MELGPERGGEGPRDRADGERERGLVERGFGRVRAVERERREHLGRVVDLVELPQPRRPVHHAVEREAGGVLGDEGRHGEERADEPRGRGDRRHAEVAPEVRGDEGRDGERREAAEADRGDAEEGAGGEEAVVRAGRGVEPDAGRKGRPKCATEPEAAGGEGHEREERGAREEGEVHPARGVEEGRGGDLEALTKRRQHTQNAEHSEHLDCDFENRSQSYNRLISHPRRGCQPRPRRPYQGRNRSRPPQIGSRKRRPPQSGP